MTDHAAIRSHYSDAGLVERIQSALDELYPHQTPVPWAELQALDQFHVRGLAAAKEIASLIQPRPGSHFLDIGCGVGGPARYLAAECGCVVTGIDLSESFVEAARRLSERTGLANTTYFVCGDALELPFEAETFENAWMLHVAMNIKDRARLYAGVRRVLKAGARFAIYEVASVGDQPLVYPVPWAAEPAQSFLITAEATRDALRDVGFAEISFSEKTQEGIAWFEQQQVAHAAGSLEAPLNLKLVMGSQFSTMSVNLARNLREGRARLIQMVLAV
jgi:sarcosine/dimethylglycine N-methyltransferase